MGETTTRPTRPTVRYCVKSGRAAGAEVFYRPRSDADRFPWEVESRWYEQYNGERRAADAVTTMERYRRQRMLRNPAS